ncbi:MAG TPA: GPR endopeptidase [Symbiobacteriaceae bacterium]|nr:GPR endopeptidase [Symbiobacteriaceae bacterium]
MTERTNLYDPPFTDLAVEATAAVRGDAHTEIPGVRMSEERTDAATVSWVEVFSPEGEKTIGKPIGNYITIDAPGLRRRNRDLQEQVGKVLVDQLAKLLHLTENGSALIVGLGNWNATPDALGPRVTSKVMVTRHLHDYVPADVAGGLRKVAAISPGVLGITGIETAEIILGIVEKIKPSVVIAVDALAARSVERIGTTVQLADTGINPGSGIGNQRKGLNKNTLGVPVIAIGVPTVVHASTIAHDTMEALHSQFQGQKAFFQLFNSPQERREMINQVISPTVGELVVTPKEIDDMIEDMSKVIAGALNAVLHTSVSSQELLKYLH